jgi:hypothetical protein
MLQKEPAKLVEFIPSKRKGLAGKKSVAVLKKSKSAR